MVVAVLVPWGWEAGEATLQGVKAGDAVVAAGAVFRYNINFRWALKANLMWGQVSGSTEGLENVFPGNAQTSFSRSVVEVGGQAEFNFFPYSDKFDYAGARRFSPYVLVGIGMTMAPGGGGLSERWQNC